MTLPICQITLDKHNSAYSIAAEIRNADQKHHLFFRANQPVLSPNLEAFIAAALLPVMVSGGGVIRVDGEVSPDLIENFPRIQADYHQWNPKFLPVSLEGAEPLNRARAPEPGTGIFFSGGVDSFYSFLTHREEITDLIFIHGADIYLQNHEYRQRLSTSLAATAAHYGKNLIELETNLRDFIDPYIPYGLWGAGRPHSRPLVKYFSLT